MDTTDVGVDLDTKRGICILAGYEIREDASPPAINCKYMDVYSPKGDYLTWCETEEDGWNVAYYHLQEINRG